MQERVRDNTVDDVTAAFEDTTASAAPKKTRQTKSKAEDFARVTARYFETYLAGGMDTNMRPAHHLLQNYEQDLLLTLFAQRYPQLHKNIYKNIAGGLPQKTTVITQNKYAAHIDEITLGRYQKSINALSQEQLDIFLHSLVHHTRTLRLQTATTVEDFTVQGIQILQDLSKNELIVPLLQSNNKKDDAELSAVHASGAADCFTSVFTPAFELLLHSLYTGTMPASKLLPELQATVTTSAVQEALGSFIEMLRTGDAYQHIYMLHRNSKALKDKQLQVYFCDITIAGKTFPLFYMPVETTHAYPSVTLTFKNIIYVNTEAIEYVNRLFAAQTGTQSDLPDLPEFIYTHLGNASAELQKVIDAVIDSFTLQQSLTVSQSALQLSTNHVVSVSNAVYFYVASIDSRAVRKQYDSILDDNGLVDETGTQLATLITNAPSRFIEEISENWDTKSSTEKLLPTIPIVSNDDQRQVLLALSKDDCDMIVVDGARGTGKSHLAAAASLDALRKKQTVLVVAGESSVSTEIGKRITDSLQTSGLSAYSPVLDMAHTELLEQLDDQAIDKTKRWLASYTAKSSEVSRAKKRKIQDATETLSNFIQNAENINLQEVEQTVYNERRFAGKSWILDEPIESISTDIQKLHRAMQYVRSSEANYLLPYVAVNQQQAINQFIGIFKEYEKTSKNVTTRLPEFIVRYRKLMTEQREQLHTNLAYIQSNYRQFIKILKSNNISKWLAITDNTTFEQLEQQETVQQKLIDVAKSADKLLRRNQEQDKFVLKELESYTEQPEEIIAAFNTYIEQIATLKSKLFGFSGRTLVVENLNKQLFKALPNCTIKEPEKDVELLQLMSQLVRTISEQLAAGGLTVNHWKEVVHILQSDSSTLQEASQIMQALVSPMRYEFMSAFHLYETDNLLANIALLHYATELNRVFREQASFGKLFGITAIGHVLARPSDYSERITKLSGDLTEASELDEAKQTIKKFIKDYPDASKRLGITMAAGNLEVIEDTFATSEPDYIKEYLAHKKKEQDIRSYFDEITIDSFSRLTGDIQQIISLQLQANLSDHALEYLEQDKKFTGLRTTLQNQEMPSTRAIQDAQAAFPCIVGDIRSIAQLLPFSGEMFDLAIVENAHTMSIADIAPILLRAKKMLVIGNPRDVRSQQQRAISERLNNMHKFELSRAVRTLLEPLPADQKNVIISKVDTTFDVAKSGYEFCKAYANYEKTLRKQYGAMPEIVSATNRFYYGNSLQVLSSRAKPLHEVFTFDHVKPTSGEAGYHTNEAEVRAIIDNLTRLKEAGYQGSIAILTPFAKQAALLQKELDECVITDWFERRELIVATFDEAATIRRDYVFYSLVASPERDWLTQILPENLKGETDTLTVRSERLLASITSAAQTMHFMLSKPIGEFTGSAKQLLEYYQTKAQGTVQIHGSTNDILLPSENDIAKIYEKTTFSKKHKKTANFIAKYPFADYLRSISGQYYKPGFKMYYLVSYQQTPIVIEYDDFKERFLQSEDAGKDMSGVLLSANDIYGQKILEGYGYRFLRVNKYNLGSDPARTLDQLLNEVIKSSSWAADNGLTVTN